MDFLMINKKGVTVNALFQIHIYTLYESVAMLLSFASSFNIFIIIHSTLLIVFYRDVVLWGRNLQIAIKLLLV